MITIVHGGHREGLCFNAAKTLKRLLNENGNVVKFYSLRDYKFGFCCGDQPCQDTGRCIYDDLITKEIIPTIAMSNALLFFTPTYFNMPPALLVNFIDRCNLLLTIENRKRLKFGAWISGQTPIEENSTEACYGCLSAYAEICEYGTLKAGKNIHADTALSQSLVNDYDIVKLQELAKELMEID
jgi:multimeric flavodoxin WrbA